MLLDLWKLHLASQAIYRAHVEARMETRAKTFELLAVADDARDFAVMRLCGLPGHAQMHYTMRHDFWAGRY